MQIHWELCFPSWGAALVILNWLPLKEVTWLQFMLCVCLRSTMVSWWFAKKINNFSTKFSLEIFKTSIWADKEGVYHRQQWQKCLCHKRLPDFWSQSSRSRQGRRFCDSSFQRDPATQQQQTVQKVDGGLLWKRCSRGMYYTVAIIMWKYSGDWFDNPKRRGNHPIYYILYLLRQTQGRAIYSVDAQA